MDLMEMMKNKIFGKKTKDNLLIETFSDFNI